MNNKNSDNLGVLGEICANKRMEIARQKEAVPQSYLENILSFQYREKISFRQALLHSDSGVIAEFKRRSPSKGWIHPKADVERIISDYEAAGAAAVSCLTDEVFFGGGFSDFKKARTLLPQTPLLRKDFILDEYQLYQSKALGADVVLLIAACLSREETFHLTETAHQLDMEVLLEIHGEEELSYIQPNVDVIGINNRDLKTFVTDIRRTIDLAHKIPNGYVKISESGLSDPETVIQLRREGFKGFLMGENFMKTDDPGKALREFISDLSPSPSPWRIKVCGMKYPDNIRALSALPVDMIGLIFHEKSPRYIGEPDADPLKFLPPSIRKTGVFVDASKEYILSKIAEYDLQMIQLHGHESPAFCRELKSAEVEIIKAIPIGEVDDLAPCVFYEDACDYFLFDTKTPQFGGSGKKFDWEILLSYKGKTPFFLSGGIDSEAIEALKQFDFPLLYAIDLNSKFEIEPGLKDVGKLSKIIKDKR
jgi:indole-3-glycerol phosphate synthase